MISVRRQTGKMPHVCFGPGSVPAKFEIRRVSNGVQEMVGFYFLCLFCFLSLHLRIERIAGKALLKRSMVMSMHYFKTLHRSHRYYRVSKLYNNPRRALEQFFSYFTHKEEEEKDFKWFIQGYWLVGDTGRFISYLWRNIPADFDQTLSVGQRPKQWDLSKQATETISINSEVTNMNKVQQDVTDITELILTCVFLRIIFRSFIFKQRFAGKG